MTIALAITETLRYLCRRTSRAIANGVNVGIKVHEETITNLNLVDVAMRHRPYVQTVACNRVEEGTTTGADWLWMIGRPGRWLPILVQAKLVNTASAMCRGFRQKLPGRKALQFDLFTQYAKAQRFYPLYCVYSDAKDSRLGPLNLLCKEGNGDQETLGCTMLLTRHVRAFNSRWRHATHKEILEKGHSLACLLRNPRGSKVENELADVVGNSLDAYSGISQSAKSRSVDSEGNEAQGSSFELIRKHLPPIVRTILMNPKEREVVPIRYLTLLSDRELPPLGSMLDDRV